MASQTAACISPAPRLHLPCIPPASSLHLPTQDNELVYCERVPAASDLPPIEAKVFAKVSVLVL